MPKNQEIVMETTHGRKPKCKTEFKAVINKVLVSGLILATLMTSTVMPAYAAANNNIALNNNGVSYTQTYGVSVEDSIYEIKATISAINEMKANGTVSDAMLQKLASQIYALGQAVNYSSEVDLNEVNSILDKAEMSVSDLSNAGDVKLAISIVRAMNGVGENKVPIYTKDSTSITNNDVIPIKITLDDNYTTTNASAPQLVQSFSDVNQGDWYYETVMEMAKSGLFAGKGEIVNGQGIFAPNDTMTRAEFITVVSRMFDLPTRESDVWWEGYYEAVINANIIKESEMPYDKMNEPITRQEMSLVAVRAMQKAGETVDTTYQPAVKAAIPDYNSVDEYYRVYVGQAYSEGILAGVDAKGTFAPKQSLNRAEAATVLYRIIKADARSPKNLVYQGGGSTVQTPDTQGAITIYEGQQRSNRLAKEGDTFVKADGTQIVLKKGPNGVLGEGQGVAPDVGLVDTVGQGSNVTHPVLKANGRLHTYSYGLDSVGGQTGDTRYQVNPLTGEGHWEKEWTTISLNTAPKVTEENYDTFKVGQISADKNFVWTGMIWKLVVDAPNLVK